MLRSLIGILRSLKFQIHTIKRRRAAERTWQKVRRTEHKTQRFAHVTLAKSEGGVVITNSFLGKKVGKQYDVRNWHVHESTPQKYAFIETNDRLQDYPSIPRINSNGIGFAVVAVFYFEWRELLPWLRYYRNQGAGHFLLYFNSNKIPEELQNTVNEATDITFIIWPFQYFSSTWRHASGHPFQSAQPIALQHALELIKTRTSFRYVLTCDLDEYIIGERTIADSLDTFPKELSFANFWARGYDAFIHGGVPVIAEEIEWKPWTRVKSVVDTTRIERLDVHRIWNEDNLTNCFMMLHFKDIPKDGWVDPFRNSASQEENTRIDEHSTKEARSIWHKYVLTSTGI